MNFAEATQRNAEDLVLAIRLLDALASQSTWYYGVYAIPDYNYRQRIIANTALRDTKFSDRKSWSDGYKRAADHLRKGIKS